ncbi:hypothetical protein [Kordiimonas sp.]|uniref:hypothetical protein n=1 Tax=Kordiimonas sp. TaxID=1970157 RepID=UPI003A8F948D
MVFLMGMVVVTGADLMSVPAYLVLSAPLVTYLGFELKLYSEGLYMRYSAEGPAGTSPMRSFLEHQVERGHKPTVLFVPVMAWGPILAAIGISMGA